MSAAILKQVLPFIFSLTVVAACLFGSAGSWNWPNAWILLGVNFVACAISMIVLWSDDGLRAERTNTKAGKSWDKPLVFIVVLLGPIATWITAGLDRRFHRSAGMNWSVVVVGTGVGLLAVLLIAWAMRTNRFFSSIVRIQKDRGHVVISSGPYRFVRHPSYTGMIAFMLVTPLILDSRLAFTPVVITVAFHLLRTALEDRALQKELDGYTEYASRVRYRLMPFIW
jgi:protein-S-isoprenylcysteine O-methyltransferase Ste14